MKRKITMIVPTIGVVVLAVLGLIRIWPQAPLDAALTFPNAPPTRLVCYGYVDSRYGPLLLQPARAGRVVRVFVQEKQTISKNVPLVQLDDHLVQLQEQEATLAIQAARLQLAKAQSGLKQYQAKQAQAEASLEAAQNKVIEAQRALDRKEELVKKEVANPIEADVGRAQLNEARDLVKVEQNKLIELQAVDPDIEVKLAQLQSERSLQLEQARQERDEYLLRAPADGLVLRVQAQEGDLVGPTSPRPVVWLVPAGTRIVRAEVSQEFAGRVQEGLEVQVEDEANANLLAKGRITEVSDWFLPRRQFSGLPTSINTGLTMECVIDLQEGQAPLRLGLRVRVRVLAEQSVGSTNEVGKTTDH